MSNENQSADDNQQNQETSSNDGVNTQSTNNESSANSETNDNAKSENNQKEQNTHSDNSQKQHGMSQREYVQQLKDRTQKSERDAKEARKEAAEAKKQAQETLTRLESIEKQRRDQVVRAELKIEANKLGVVDFNDFLKIASDQISKIEINPDGEVNGISQLIQTYKESKPWLFKEDTSKSTTGSTFRVPVQKEVGKNDVSKLPRVEYKKAKDDFLRNLRNK